MQTIKESRSKHPGRALVFLTHPTVLLIVVIVMLVHWRVPTRVRFEFVADWKTPPTGPIDVTAVLRSIHDDTLQVKEGTVSYPDYPEIQAVSFTFPDRIEIEAFEELQLEKMIMGAADKEIRFCLEGVVKYMSIRSSGSLRDLRLTKFTALKESRWIVTSGITLWLVATIIGWYRVYSELKG